MLEISCSRCAPALHAHAHHGASSPRRRWPLSRGIPYAYSTWRCHLMGRRSSPAQATRRYAFGTSSLVRRPRETPPTLPLCSISKGAPPSANPPAQPSAHPAARPSAHPAAQPFANPAAQPSAHPAAQPFAKPAAQPSTIQLWWPAGAVAVPYPDSRSPIGPIGEKCSEC